MERRRLSHLAHPDVLRLDVPMGDALLIEPLDGLEEILTETLEKLEVEPALLP